MRGGVSATRQIAEKHRRFDGQGLCGTKSAALRAHYQSHAGRAKRMSPIHAGYGQRDLNPQARAAPDRFGCQYLHVICLQQHLEFDRLEAVRGRKKWKNEVTEVTSAMPC